MSGASFIEPDELAARLGDERLRLVDGSWYLPAQKRDAAGEFARGRIPGAVRFDIEAICDHGTALPHMLPSPADFASAVGALGIGEDDDIVVYDGPGVMTAARVWWTFRAMGARRVRILAGGFDGWARAGLPVETGAPPAPRQASFRPAFDPSVVTDLQGVRDNIESRRALVLDARSFERFAGRAPEPRAGLRSGHIPGSRPLPWDSLVVDGRLRPRDELQRILAGVGVTPERRVITSCGSGVTAAVIILALVETGHADHVLYDGSWAEWGAAEDVPVALWSDEAVA